MDQPKGSTKPCGQDRKIQYRQGKCGQVDGFNQKSTFPTMATSTSQQLLIKDTQQIEGTNQIIETRMK